MDIRTRLQGLSTEEGKFWDCHSVLNMDLIKEHFEIRLGSLANRDYWSKASAAKVIGTGFN